jgi:hypothetical protein
MDGCVRVALVLEYTLSAIRGEKEEEARTLLTSDSVLPPKKGWS